MTLVLDQLEDSFPQLIHVKIVEAFQARKSRNLHCFAVIAATLRDNKRREELRKAAGFGSLSHLASLL